VSFNGPAILDCLTRHEVAYVLIGGFAAAAHGSPIPTMDIDITPQRTRDNLDRLSAALDELGAKVRVEGSEALPFAHDAISRAGIETLNLTTQHGDLDLAFQPAGTQGYDDLRRDAIAIEIGGARVLLASLADIVRSKAAAGRDKDRRALPVLRELLARQQR